MLEAAGFHVTIPAVQLCCGRPLYDYGMLDLAATHVARGARRLLRPQIRAGVCVVGLEPSCVSVFRDEMTNLLGPDEDAKRLKEQTYLLTEFLARRRRPSTAPPRLDRKALVQEHCHQEGDSRHVWRKQAVRRARPRLRNTRHRVLRDGRTVRIRCRALRRIDDDRRARAPAEGAGGERYRRRSSWPNGFSCREQISQTTHRQAMHPAQVLKMAIDERGKASTGALPELRYMPSDARPNPNAWPQRALNGTIGLLVLAAGMAAAAWLTDVGQLVVPWRESSFVGLEVLPGSRRPVRSSRDGKGERVEDHPRQPPQLHALYADASGGRGRVDRSARHHAAVASRGPPRDERRRVLRV